MQSLKKKLTNGILSVVEPRFGSSKLHGPFKQGCKTGLTSIRIQIQHFSSIRIRIQIHAKPELLQTFFLKFLRTITELFTSFLYFLALGVGAGIWIPQPDLNPQSHPIQIHSPVFKQSEWDQIRIENRVLSIFLDQDPAKSHIPPDPDFQQFYTVFNISFTRVKLRAEL
jgi:hypothetical protein